VRAHVAGGALALAALLALAFVAVQLFGDPRALGPRAMASIGADTQPYAPRIAFADAATPGDPDALLGAPSNSSGLPAVTVDPGLDAAGLSASLGGGLKGGGLKGAGLKGGLGDLPPTLDPMPDALTRPATSLARAPLPGLHTPGAGGLLPMRAADGRTPANAYARPFANGNRRPMVALVVGGLGFNPRATQAAIEELPAEVTLSFMPYTQGLQGWIDRARAIGHEVLIEAPMESWDPRADDAGPNTLTIAAAPSENVARLEAVLARATGYFGVMNYLGQRFATIPQASAPIATALKDRGLIMIGNGIGARSAFGLEAARAGLPFAPADRVIDARRNADAIGEQLLALETLAQRNGVALGVGFAFPVTIEQIKVWTQDLHSRGFALAPASAALAARSAR